MRRRDRARRGVRGRAALAVPPPLRRRVPGRHAAAAARCCARGSATGDDLTVVGDPAQAIYGFTGADAAPLDRVRPRVSRRADDRARPQLPQHARGRRARRGRARSRAGGAAPSPPEAVRADGARADDRRRTTTTTRRRARSPKRAGRTTRPACRGTTWPCCSARTRSRSRFEAAFTRRGVPVPHRRRPAVRAPTAVRALLDELREAERSARRGRSRTTSPTSPRRRREADRPTGAETSTDDWRHRDALLELGRDYLEAVGGAAASPSSGVARHRPRADQDERARHGVDLVTFHRAKGLEWTVVFVTGLERGLVPISWATTPTPRPRNDACCTWH